MSYRILSYLRLTTFLCNFYVDKSFKKYFLILLHNFDTEICMTFFTEQNQNFRKIVNLIKKRIKTRVECYKPTLSPNDESRAIFKPQNRESVIIGVCMWVCLITTERVARYNVFRQLGLSSIWYICSGQVHTRKRWHGVTLFERRSVQSCNITK